MSPPRIITVLLLSVTAALCSAAPTLPGIGAAMDALIAQNEIAGAVTVVVTPDRTLHLESNGHADVSTTMIYTHVLNRGPAGVRSPADRLLGE